METTEETETGWMDERCFRPLLCTVKAELGRGQPGLMRCIWDETLPQSETETETETQQDMETQEKTDTRDEKEMEMEAKTDKKRGETEKRQATQYRTFLPGMDYQ